MPKFIFKFLKETFQIEINEDFILLFIFKGSITVASPLDREEKDTYTLVVQAWDNYDYGFSTGESRKAFKQVNASNFNQLMCSTVKDRNCTLAKSSEFFFSPQISLSEVKLS